jgi:hypothetical protein
MFVHPSSIKHEALELVADASICPRCWRVVRRRIVFTDEDYAELFGLYLDTRYVQIISDAQALLRRCFPEGSVGLARSAEGTTTIISLYCSRHPAALHRRL